MDLAGKKIALEQSLLAKLGPSKVSETSNTQQELTVQQNEGSPFYNLNEKILQKNTDTSSKRSRIQTKLDFDDDSFDSILSRTASKIITAKPISPQTTTNEKTTSNEPNISHEKLALSSQEPHNEEIKTEDKVAELKKIETPNPQGNIVSPATEGKSQIHIPSHQNVTSPNFQYTEAEISCSKGQGADNTEKKFAGDKQNSIYLESNQSREIQPDPTQKQNNLASGELKQENISSLKDSKQEYAVNNLSPDGQTQAKESSISSSEGRNPLLQETKPKISEETLIAKVDMEKNFANSDIALETNLGLKEEINGLLDQKIDYKLNEAGVTEVREVLERKNQTKFVSTVKNNSAEDAPSESLKEETKNSVYTESRKNESELTNPENKLKNQVKSLSVGTLQDKSEFNSPEQPVPTMSEEKTISSNIQRPVIQTRGEGETSSKYKSAVFEKASLEENVSTPDFKPKDSLPSDLEVSNEVSQQNKSTGNQNLQKILMNKESIETEIDSKESKLKETRSVENPTSQGTNEATISSSKDTSATKDEIKTDSKTQEIPIQGQARKSITIKKGEPIQHPVQQSVNQNLTNCQINQEAVPKKENLTQINSQKRKSFLMSIQSSINPPKTNQSREESRKPESSLGLQNHKPKLRLSLAENYTRRLSVVNKGDLPAYITKKHKAVDDLEKQKKDNKETESTAHENFRLFASENKPEKQANNEKAQRNSSVMNEAQTSNSKSPSGVREYNRKQ